MRRSTALLTALTLTACTAPAPPTPEELSAHARGVSEFFEKHEKGLRSPSGFLALAGLAWLKEGANPVGSAAANFIRLPESAPANLGTLLLESGKIRFEAAPGTKVLIGDKETTQAELKPEGGAAATVKTGSVSFYVIERTGKIGVRIKDTENPALKNFKGVDRFPIDWSWRIPAAFHPYTPPRKVAVPNVLGTDFIMDSPGEVVFEKNGQQYRLETIGGPDDDSLWVIFADATNGKETYGAGRFLSVERGPRDHAVVDFNLAYNPPCAFTPYATCPIPRERNKIKLRVTAGEKNYAHATRNH